MAYRSVTPNVLLSKSLLVSLILSYFVFCSSLVFLLSLYCTHCRPYRAAVSALLSLVVLLIMLCEIACGMYMYY